MQPPLEVGEARITKASCSLAKVLEQGRIACRPGPKARQRVEFLKRRREVWEQIYYHLTKEEATATLLTLEEAHKQVPSSYNFRPCIGITKT